MVSILRERERKRERKRPVLFLKEKKKNQSIPLINVEYQRPKSLPLPSTVIKIGVF